MGTVKDRNGMDLTEAEDIKKSGKNTQKNDSKKIFRGRSQDGGGIGRGDLFLFYKFIERTTER